MKALKYLCLLIGCVIMVNSVAARGPFRPAVPAGLTEVEKNNLIFLREEEKLARDVYLTMYEAWGDRIFYTISQAEQRHTDAVKAMLAKYKVADPVSDDTVGVFSNPTLAALYDQLAAEGMQSLEAALNVGVIIEEMDIAALKVMLSETNKADLKQMMTNLLNGSYNHLRAFNYRLSLL